MTVYRPGLPPDVEHRWLRWRRRCTCGWTSTSFRNLWWPGSPYLPINYPHHLRDMAEWEERTGGKRGPFRFGRA